MSTLTEYTLFKQCVEKPSCFDKNLSKLNLTFVKDITKPTAEGTDCQLEQTEDNSLECNQRKALRLYQMIWSGVTKILVSCVNEKGKAVEFPNLAIFGPINDRFANMRDPLDKGPARRGPLPKKTGLDPVISIINEDFLDSSGAAIDYKSEKAVGVFSKQDRKEILELFGNSVSSLDLTSISKVCFTDNYTVDLMLQEFVSQMSKAVQAGNSLRINMKLGHLLVKSGLVQFAQSVILGQTKAQNDGLSSMRASSTTVLENCSVMTPSMAAPSIGVSSVRTFNNHASNPNPDGKDARFRHIRDVGYDRHNLKSTSERKQLDMLQFGKRVIFDQRLSNADVLESHLAQIHEHLSDRKQIKEQRDKEEREKIEQLAKIMEDEKRIKQTQKELVNKDLVQTNQQLKAHTDSIRNYEIESFKKDKLDYFPFVSGKVIEDHKKLLNDQLRSDMQIYMKSKAVADSRRKQMVGSGLAFTDRQSGTAAYEPKPYPGFTSSPNCSASNHSRMGESRLTRAGAPTVSSLKDINDPKYIRPQENWRVIQKDDSAKKAVLDDALKRFKLQKEKESNFEQRLEDQASERAQRVINEETTKADKIRKKQEDMREVLMKQITENAQKSAIRHQEKKEKQLNAYGPVDNDTQHEERMAKLKATNLGIQQHHLEQMAKKKEKEDLIREKDISMEEKFNKLNNDALAIEAERQIKLRNDTVTHWQEEISFARQFRDEEKQAMKKQNKNKITA